MPYTTVPLALFIALPLDHVVETLKPQIFLLKFFQLLRKLLILGPSSLQLLGLGDSGLPKYFVSLLEAFYSVFAVVADHY